MGAVARKLVPAVTAVTLAAMWATPILAWRTLGCVRDAPGSSWTGGYCAPDTNRQPVLWWDIGSDGVDIGGGRPLSWEIYLSAPHAEAWGRRIGRR